jgi:cobalamin-dependent methionine synthase I
MSDGRKFIGLELHARFLPWCRQTEMDFYVVIQEQEQAYKAVFMHLAWMAVSLV